MLGVTATPVRTDGRGLDEIFETLVLGPSIRELTAQGFLTPAVVYAPARRLDLSGIRTRAGDYDRHQLADAMDTPTITGDAVDHYRRLCPGVPAVVFCVSIQHAEDVAADFAAAGFRSAAISGKMPVQHIRDTVAGLTDGRVQVLTSCDLISEGFDCPVVEAAILLRPTQSEALYIQQVGRALRPSPGKSRAVILDHSGNCFRHGMPDEEREWSLAGRQRRRGAPVAAVPVRQCPKCFACHKPAPMCPQCGHVYAPEAREVEQRAGELEQISSAKVAKARALKSRIRAARTLDDFHAIARDFGYRKAWASIRFQITQKYRGASW